jgi:hypothetical protein
MATIEGENFAWIDYFWSTLGRSGDVGRDVSFVYNMVQDERAAKRLAANFSRPLADAVPSWLPGRRWVAERAFRKVAGVLLDHQRLRKEDPDRPDDRKRLRGLLEQVLVNDLGASTARPHPTPVTFLFGHTHMPFGASFDVDGFAHPITVHNTGGWVVDEVTPEVGLGGAVVLLDDSLDAVRLELFRQRPHETVSVPRVEAVEGDGNFADAVRAAVDTSRDPWRALTPVVSTTMQERRRMVAAAIERGIAEASRPPHRPTR